MNRSGLIGKLLLDKYKIIPVFLLVLGIIFFCVAGYCYWWIMRMHGIFSYYGMSEENYLSNQNVAQTFLNLKFGIVRFLILGIVSIAAGIFLLLKNRKVKFIK